MADQQDFLDELDAERTAANSEFPAILAAVRERRAFIRSLAAKREELGISQAEIARRMSSTQPYVSRFESGEIDPSHSFEDRFAAAIGYSVKRTLVRGRPDRDPSRVSGDPKTDRCIPRPEEGPLRYGQHMRAER